MKFISIVEIGYLAFNPSQKSPEAYSLWDEWNCAFSARDESLNFSPGEIQFSQRNDGF